MLVYIGVGLCFFLAFFAKKGSGAYTAGALISGLYVFFAFMLAMVIEYQARFYRFPDGGAMIVKDEDLSFAYVMQVHIDAALIFAIVASPILAFAIGRLVRRLALRLTHSPLFA